MKRTLLFILPFFFCLLLLIHLDQSFTQDLGRHIKTGEIILSTHSVPKINLFSYTQPNHIFINHHWGSEVLFYLLYKNLGADSLLVLKILLILTSFGIVYFLAFKKSPQFAFLASFFYIYLFSYRFDTRPELFSFMFISLFVFLISKYQESKNIRLLLVLPLIELFWVNMHIYFIVGIVLLGCYLIAEFIKNKKIDPKVLGIFIATSLVTIINPSGFLGATEPLRILSSYGYSIIENQSVFFLNTFFFDPHLLIYEILALIFVILSLLSLKKTDTFLLISGLVATVLGFQMVRNFPIFVLVTLPLFVWSLNEINQKIKDRKTFQALLFILTPVFAVVILYSAISSQSFGVGYVKGADKAIEYYQKSQLKGPIFNNFDIGSYLIFKLYPAEKVFVDGRPEAYSVKFFDDYKKMQTDPKFFDQQVRRYNIRTIFFAHTDITPWAQQFLFDISKNPNWKRVYLDNRIVILVRK